MTAYVRIQDNMNDAHGKESGIKATLMTTLPSITYSIVISILNNLYLRTATKLNDWGKKCCLFYMNLIVLML